MKDTRIKHYDLIDPEHPYDWFLNHGYDKQSADLIISTMNEEGYYMDIDMEITQIYGGMSWGVCLFRYC